MPTAAESERREKEMTRRCEYDPAFQWLTGMEAVNDHTLADFRVEKAEELDELFTNLLHGVLSAKGLITLEEVMQDGTKIKAGASSGSFDPGEDAAGTFGARAATGASFCGIRWPSRRRTGISKRRGNEPCKRSKNGWKKRWPNWRSCAR